MAARDDAPTVAEIAELTARLRRLSAAGRDADPAERAAFLADKDALIARIEAANRRADTADDSRADPADAGNYERGDDGGPATADQDAADLNVDDDGDGWSR